MEKLRPALLREAAPSNPEIKMSPELLKLQINPEMGMYRLATDFSLIVKSKRRNAQEPNRPEEGQYVSSATQDVL